MFSFPPKKIFRYLTCGDEVECCVSRTPDLDKFTYTEEEEEVGEDGDVKKR